ncbi:hypothetical protein Tco_0480303 [Tanacetum coccineum]
MTSPARGGDTAELQRWRTKTLKRDRIIERKVIDDGRFRKLTKKTLRTPFTRRIIDFPANLGNGPCHVRCRMFQQTLDGSARGWFGEPFTPYSIDEWWRLREAFTLDIQTRKACYKEPHEYQQDRSRGRTTTDFFYGCQKRTTEIGRKLHGKDFRMGDYRNSTRAETTSRRERHREYGAPYHHTKGSVQTAPVPQRVEGICKAGLCGRRVLSGRHGRTLLREPYGEHSDIWSPSEEDSPRACKEQLKYSLKAHGVFAWKPADMTGGTRKVIGTLLLNVKPRIDPVMSKEKNLLPEKAGQSPRKLKVEAVWVSVQVLIGCLQRDHQIQMAKEDEEKKAFYTEEDDLFRQINVFAEIHMGFLRIDWVLELGSEEGTETRFGLPENHRHRQWGTTLQTEPYGRLKTRLGREMEGWVDELPNVLWLSVTSSSNATASPLQLTYGSDTVIRRNSIHPTIVEIREDSTKKSKFELDYCRSEARAAIREARYKSKMENELPTTEVRPAGFRP